MTDKTLTQRFYDKEELTIAERKRLGAGDIRINRAKCLNCQEIVTSDHRHDMKVCKCKSVAVDGGSWYIRRMVRDGVKYEDMSESYLEVEEEEECEKSELKKTP